MTVFPNYPSYLGGSYMKIQGLATTFGYRVAILTLENMTQFIITHSSSEDRENLEVAIIGLLLRYYF